MTAALTLMILTMLRLVIPFGLTLLVGSLVQHYEASHMEPPAWSC